MTSVPRKKIGRYEILSLLGAGGMGEVYLAQDTRLDRKVALKILPADVTGHDRARRFIQEAKAASALNHPNIITIYEIDEVDSNQFIATEFIDGETLRERIRKATLTLHEAVDIVVQVAGALCATHGVGIIHRDIKPENIMLRRDGIVKVLDFGLAKIAPSKPLTETDPEAPTEQWIQTDAGIVMGTAQYMSPEQARGLQVDARTDIWSLGCVLYEMITARQPFRGETSLDVMSAILHTQPEPLSHPELNETRPELERILNRALRKDREERYQAIKDLLIELKDLKVELKSQSRSLSSPGMDAESRRNVTYSSATASEKSIAVLYFENMNANRDSEYFCAGITEDIITDLSKINHLKVVPRTDVVPFRNKEINIRQVGEALRVNYLLQGSVRTAGNRIRVNTQLVKVQDGYHLWAERFDGLVDDVFDLQNEVAHKIATALKVSLTESEIEQLAQKPTDDLRAYDFYMRGRELLYLKGKKNTEQAIEMFKGAVAIDPKFASAYAGLAEAYSAMYEWYDGSARWLTEAIEMNQEALTWDPTLLEAQFGIAMVYFHHRKLVEAKATLESLLKQNSEFQPGYFRLGIIEERLGDLNNALNYFRRSTEINPSDEDSWRFLAGVQEKLGNHDAAFEAAVKVIEVTARKLEASLDDIIVMSKLAEAYARFGGRPEASATLRRVFELDPNDGLALYNCACAYALLGEEQEAFISLRRAFDCGFRTVSHWVETDNSFDTLRKNPEFQRFIAQLQ